MASTLCNIAIDTNYSIHEPLSTPAFSNLLPLPPLIRYSSVVTDPIWQKKIWPTAKNGVVLDTTSNVQPI